MGSKNSKRDGKDFSTPKENVRKQRSQGKFQSRFDALMKDLMEDFSAQILSYLLGIKVVSLQLLDRELTKLKVSKRHVDFLAKIKYEINGEEKEELFHVEFQAQNDRNMPQRMLRYMLDIFERYGEVPSQVVVYLGKEPLNMSSFFKYSKTFTHISYKFKLLDITSIPSERFLESRNPDLALLGVLGSSKDVEEVLKEILLIIKEGSNSTEELIVSVTKLELVGQLRGISRLVYKKVVDLLGLDIRKLESYKLGKKEGKKEGKKVVVDVLLSIVSKRLHPEEKELDEIRKQLEKINDLEKLKKLAPIVLEVSSIKELKEAINKK